MQPEFIGIKCKEPKYLVGTSNQRSDLVKGSSKSHNWVILIQINSYHKLIIIWNFFSCFFFFLGGDSTRGTQS